MQHMVEMRSCFITGTHRGPGVDIAGDEPSHIHLPRRRRSARPDDQGISATRGVRIGDQDYGVTPTDN